MSRNQRERIFSFDRNEFYKNPDKGFDVPPLCFEQLDQNGWTTFAKAILTKENGLQKYVEYAKKHKMGIAKRKLFATYEKKPTKKFVKISDEKDTKLDKSLQSKREHSQKKPKKKSLPKFISPKKKLCKKRNHLQEEKERIKKIQKRMIQDKQLAKKSRMNLLKKNYNKTEPRVSPVRSPRSVYYMSDRLKTLAQPRENQKENSTFVMDQTRSQSRNSPQTNKLESKDDAADGECEEEDEIKQSPSLPYLYHKDMEYCSGDPKLSSHKDSHKDSTSEPLLEPTKIKKLRAEAMKMIYSKH
ncbi:unnamed protein product [Moneuplotes crassus]|uniref:Uncharacterized protein n=1 Tax=Euplotes crassus TaxID=5936 RepID=A0AAD1UGX3_EUPCR|nr:unnamed protein product [Moneuplotes crassus]